MVLAGANRTRDVAVCAADRMRPALRPQAAAARRQSSGAGSGGLTGLGRPRANGRIYRLSPDPAPVVRREWNRPVARAAGGSGRWVGSPACVDRRLPRGTRFPLNPGIHLKASEPRWTVTAANLTVFAGPRSGGVRDRSSGEEPGKAARAGRPVRCDLTALATGGPALGRGTWSRFAVGPVLHGPVSMW
jgi:hypothetical protein